MSFERVFIASKVLCRNGIKILHVTHENAHIPPIAAVVLFFM